MAPKGLFFFFSFFTSPFLKTIASIVYKKGKGKKKWRNYFSFFISPFLFLFFYFSFFISLFLFLLFISPFLFLLFYFSFFISLFLFLLKKKKKEEENTVFQKPSNLQDSNSALMVVYEVTTHRSSILKDLMDAFRSNKVI